MGKFRSLIRLAAVVGPTAIKLVQTYGPQIRQLIHENPQYLQIFKGRLSLLSAGSGRAVKQLSERVSVLREQTAYLYGAANSAEMAQQAARWRDELESIAKVLPVLNQLERAEKKKMRKNIDKHVDELAAKIVQATLEDDIEDAEIVTEEGNN
ncbi:hypothetical protein JTE88_04680 [Arcanobacterium phocisimile]|uniref:Uncharacterized protein n=1 Tax=Arcanobacterium phocisimile TaxID=1302235 RepID=A0ABX7IEJ3_9ACTO|nr:hypothetical protein [Arcanobacterium phocisimile]QRV01417.1 hypothetical protein JTE88_04680 [Arcanobacterium phocisimile]